MIQHLLLPRPASHPHNGTEYYHRANGKVIDTIIEVVQSVRRFHLDKCKRGVADRVWSPLSNLHHSWYSLLVLGRIVIAYTTYRTLSRIRHCFRSWSVFVTSHEHISQLTLIQYTAAFKSFLSTMTASSAVPRPSSHLHKSHHLHRIPATPSSGHNVHQSTDDLQRSSRSSNIPSYSGRWPRSAKASALGGVLSCCWKQSKRYADSCCSASPILAHFYHHHYQLAKI